MNSNALLALFGWPRVRGGVGERSPLTVEEADARNRLLGPQIISHK